jgi:glycerol-3-phosphate dehydrogenase (NAD(P)+)
VTRVAILGAGSWGTALAIHLGRIGHEVCLWARDGALAADVEVRRVNELYLPGAVLPDNVRVTDSLASALAGAPLVVSAVPSQGCRLVVRAARPFLEPAATVVSTTKGLEPETHLRMSQVIAQELDETSAIVVLSGPTFATEVARQLPTAVLVASHDGTAIELVQREFRSGSFRLYGSADVVGVEITGALKNVIAIAAGVVEGLGLGLNAMAALVTRGLAEIARLAIAAGGRRETPSGLSGLGDLVLTCTGSLSRNRHVGVELGRGRPLNEILAGMKMVAEGVNTTNVALALGQQYGVELPITTQMAAVLAGRCDVQTALEALMLRPQRHEVDVT